MSVTPIQVTWPSARGPLVWAENRALSSLGATATANYTAAGNLLPSGVLSPRTDAGWRSASLTGFAESSRSFSPGLSAAPESGTVSLRIDIGQAVRFSGVVLARSNIRVPWRWKAYAGNPASNLPIAESTWRDPIIRAPIESFSFDDFEIDLGPSAAKIAALAAARRLDALDLNTRAIGAETALSDVIGARSLEIEMIASSSNGDADYLHIGQVIVGRVLHLHGISAGAAIDPRDPSEIVETPTGGLSGLKRRILRSFPLDIGLDSIANIWTEMLSEWIVERGSLHSVYLVPYPGIEYRRRHYETAMLCQARAASGFGAISARRGSASIDLSEVP